MNHNNLGNKNATITIYRNHFWGKETLISQISSYVVRVIGDLQGIEVTKHLLVEICQQTKTWEGQQ